jgi:hypothetical protein
MTKVVSSDYNDENDDNRDGINDEDDLRAKRATAHHMVLTATTIQFVRPF